jgi:hypothetical protein
MWRVTTSVGAITKTGALLANAGVVAVTAIAAHKENAFGYFMR